MSTKDREKWDKRYAQTARSAPTPPAALINNIELLSAGRLLDVACGEGAVSVYLSARPEFQVTAIDISAVGLQTLASLVLEQGGHVTTLNIELDDLSAVANLGCFESICLFKFKPSRALITTLAHNLVAKGRLMISTFNQRHHHETGFNRSFCLSANELFDQDDDLKLIHFEQSNHPPFTDTYVFEKL